LPTAPLQVLATDSAAVLFGPYDTGAWSGCVAGEAGDHASASFSTGGKTMIRLHRVLLGLVLAGTTLVATPVAAAGAPAARGNASTVIGNSTEPSSAAAAPTGIGPRRACVYGRGTVFNPNTGCRSNNALFIMQSDGNLVLYRANGSVKWASYTQGNPGAFAVFQNDGNFVVYNASRTRALWNSITYGRGADRLAVQDDGNVVIYATTGAVLWAV
jgi:hypothetical protein